MCRRVTLGEPLQGPSERRERSITNCSTTSLTGGPEDYLPGARILSYWQPEVGKQIDVVAEPSYWMQVATLSDLNPICARPAGNPWAPVRRRLLLQALEAHPGHSASLPTPVIMVGRRAAVDHGARALMSWRACRLMPRHGTQRRRSN